MNFKFSAQSLNVKNLHICFVNYNLDIARSECLKNKINSRVYLGRGEWDYGKLELRERRFLSNLLFKEERMYQRHHKKISWLLDSVSYFKIFFFFK